MCVREVSSVIYGSMEGPQNWRRNKLRISKSTVGYIVDIRVESNFSCQCVKRFQLFNILNSNK